MLSSCGFKVVNQSANTKYYVEKVNLIGDKRVNYKIRNQLNISLNDSSKKPIILNLATKKIKKIKEKNIKNEIAKYEISLISSIKLNFLEKNQEHKFSVTSSGDYLTDDKYSVTIKNEKRLIEDLTNDISNKIKNRISLITNDL